MKTTFLKISILTATIITFFLIYKWDLVQYGWQQARGQFLIMYDAKPLDFYLDNENYPDSLKSKIELVKQVKNFSSKHFGFSSSEQYQKMYDQKGQHIMWVVTASHPYKLESYQWKFPILGKVSYKGFFVKEEALKLEEELIDKGYDVRVRTASAWSTLGWLNDPLLSNVLQYSNGRITELIFHELVHDEVFIPDSVEFNENLASFLGQEFAKHFLKSHADQYKNELSRYKDLLEDKRQLNRFVRNYLPRFDSLYNEIEDYSVTKKEHLKFTFFEDFKVQLSKEEFRNPRYVNSVVEDSSINNAHLLSFQRYSGSQDILEDKLENKFNGNAAAMLDFYQKNFDSL